MNPPDSCSSRMKILESIGHNLDIIPNHLVTLDLQTDSLSHLDSSYFPQMENISQNQLRNSLSAEEILKQAFGFPFIFSVSQGRLAEAIFSQTIIRNGHYIPGSALFPTTRLHQEQNGGTPIEITINESLDDTNTYPFKGNINISALEQIIETYHPKWIPYICIEPCNNAIGGHPISLENMRSVSELARHYKIPVYLDACRLIDNVLMIQNREEDYKYTSIDIILQKFCSYADGCTMSATKNFLTPVGGFFATRDLDLFHRSLDKLALFGSGLSYSSQKYLASAVCDLDDIFNKVRERMKLVKNLHLSLGKSCQLAQPEAGHAVFLSIKNLNLNLPKDNYPGEAFLHRLYYEYGIRGSILPNTQSQVNKDIRYIRFALPIVGLSEKIINDAAIKISLIFQDKESIKGLKLIEKHQGLTGFLRSKYQLI